MSVKSLRTVNESLNVIFKRRREGGDPGNHRQEDNTLTSFGKEDPA